MTARVVLLPLTVGVVSGVIVTAGLVLYAADSALRAWEAVTRG